MQSLDDNPNDEEKLEKLDQDFDTPFSEPPDIRGQQRLSHEHPATDSEADEDEWYDKGRNSVTDMPDNPRDDPPHGRRIA